MASHSSHRHADSYQPIDPHLNRSAADDHRQMMQQLGIKSLRRGPSSNEQDPNHANYDEAKANAFTSLPDALTLKNGQRVTTRALWSRRREELVEEFAREVYGRIPKNVPRVTWKLIASDTGTVGGRRVTGSEFIGHVDNSTFPEITVDIPSPIGKRATRRRTRRCVAHSWQC